MLNSAFGYLRLMRAANCLITFFSVIATSFFVTRSLAPSALVWLGAAAASLITAGGNALNDYFDHEIDKINKPDRPIPSGLVSRNAALVFSVILLGLGAGASLFLNFPASALAIMNACLLIVYARYSKAMSLAGNILVALLTSSVFVFAGLILRVINFNVVVLAGSAFFVMLSREILKDIEDIEGDRRAGATTLPIRAGVGRARAAATIFVIPAALLIFLPVIFRTTGWGYLVPIVPATLALGFSFFQPPEKSQKTIKGAAVLVLLAFVAGSF